MGFDLRSRGDGARSRVESTAAGVPGKRTRSEDLVVQRSPNPQAGACAESTEAVQHAALQGVSGPGGALPHLDQIQSLFGRHDVTGVKAHVGGAATAAAQNMGAQAYATGDQVAFQSSPSLHL